MSFFSHNYLPWKGGDIQLNNIHNCKTKKAPKLCENVFKECTVFQIHKMSPILDVKAWKFLVFSITFLQLLGLWNLLIWSISAFKNCKNSSKSNFTVPEFVKMADFEIIDSFHVKFEWQKNPVIFTLCYYVCISTFESLITQCVNWRIFLSWFLRK